MGTVDHRGAAALRERLAAGEAVLGLFQLVPHPTVTELAGFAGFDLVVCDTEHTTASLDRIADLVRAADAVGLPSVVRVGATDARTIGHALETSCVGVQLPVVRSAEQAAAAVAATRYPPRGVRGMAIPRRAGFGTLLDTAGWVEASADGVLVVAQVEDAAGVEAVETIAATDGVDVVFVGLTDLSLDLGVPGDYAHPAVQAAVDRTIAAARSAGKAAGFPVGSAAAARELRERGATYLCFSDVGLLRSAAREALASVRGAS